MPTSASRFLAFTLATLLALMISFGLVASRAWAAQGSLTTSGLVSESTIKTQASKIYPSKKAAKEAVIAKVKAKWKKMKVKAKVVEASKAKMTAEQKKSYKKYLRRAGKNAKNYKYYVVTIKKPTFTVKAKYRDGKGKVRTYSLKAHSDGCNLTLQNYDEKKDAVKWLMGYWGDTKKEVCELYAVRKGSGTCEYSCVLHEGNTKLTGTRTSGDDFSTSYEQLDSAEIRFKLKG